MGSWCGAEEVGEKEGGVGGLAQWAGSGIYSAPGGLTETLAPLTSKLPRGPPVISSREVGPVITSFHGHKQLTALSKKKRSKTKCVCGGVEGGCLYVLKKKTCMQTTRPGPLVTAIA